MRTLTHARPSRERLRRRLAGVEALVADTASHETRRRAVLVLVHEAVRRQLAGATDPREAPIAHFDAERWSLGEHDRRREYEALVERVRERATRVIPAGARVAMVSRGDDRLLDLRGRVAVHFPQQPDGQYAGFYPDDDRDAIEGLRAIRARGTRYVVFPATALWWLDFYPGLARWLTPSSLWAGEDCHVFELPEAHEDKERSA
jgi:hypothetical protein